MLRVREGVIRAREKKEGKLKSWSKEGRLLDIIKEGLKYQLEHEFPSKRSCFYMCLNGI